MNTTSMDVGPTVAGEPNISTVEKLERKTYFLTNISFFPESAGTSQGEDVACPKREQTVCGCGVVANVPAER